MSCITKKNIGIRFIRVDSYPVLTLQGWIRTRVFFRRSLSNPISQGSDLVTSKSSTLLHIQCTDSSRGVHTAQGRGGGRKEGLRPPHLESGVLFLFLYLFSLSLYSVIFFLEFFSLTKTSPLLDILYSAERSKAAVTVSTNLHKVYSPWTKDC